MSTIALVGNPNVGKTAVFNALTGLNQSTGNYPGVTIDRKRGRVDTGAGNPPMTLVDLPGTYSLAAHAPDEMIVVDVLLDQQRGEEEIDGLLVVLDASNLERNLYLLSQLIELDKPLVIALNMMDIASRRAIQIDIPLLSRLLQTPVVPVCAHKGLGIAELRTALGQLAWGALEPPPVRATFPAEQQAALDQLQELLLNRRGQLGRNIPRLEAFRILVDEGGYAEQRVLKLFSKSFPTELQKLRHQARTMGGNLAAQEARVRYGWVRGVLEQAVVFPPVRKRTRSEQIDNYLIHRVWGTLFFVGIMAVLFQCIFTWAVPVMELIESGIGSLGALLGAGMNEGMLRSLLVDGIIAGVGSVLVFLPQILILSFFIAVLEDFGYMARAAFLMDRLLGWCGLSGQSFLPMLSSFACAIPGILATRTIRDRRDRFTTILVAPLMSCSARLPVYTILIAAFVPAERYLSGLIGLQGLTLFFMYCLGVVVAVPASWILRKTLFRGDQPPFILEIPSYKIPQARTVFRKVYREGREFLVRAGTLILAVTIVVWALAYFPRSPEIAETFEAQRATIELVSATPEQRAEELRQVNFDESATYLRESYLGRAGRWIEPVFTPLGWDWRIATATIASFPAREIVIATLGTLFHLGSEVDEADRSLITTLQDAKHPDGTPLFTFAVALSIMVFFALCCQCAATLAIIKRETRQWRWPLLCFTYMTVLAYVASWIMYNAAVGLGWD